MSLGPKHIRIKIIIIIILHRLDDLNNNTEELSAQQSQLEAAESLADILDGNGTLDTEQQDQWDAADATQSSIEQSLASGEWAKAETEFYEMN